MPQDAPKQRRLDFRPVETGSAATEARRLSRQCREILALLRERREVSNAELAAVALKYTGRISEIRQAGYDVRVVRRDRDSGLTHYRLVEDSPFS